MTDTNPSPTESVTINDDLVRRLRGEYAVGPTLPNGEPEFGWKRFGPPTAICLEAADEIERLRASSTPAPQRQTVDDAAVERASLAYEKFFEPINGVSDRGKVSYSTCGRGFNNEKEAVDYMKAMRMRAALLAAFPQEN